MRRLLLTTVAVCTSCVAACGDDADCGPSDEPETIAAEMSIEGEAAALPLTFGEWISSPNNDCGEPDGPVSLTLEGRQEGVNNRTIVFCLPRPDKLGATAQDIGNESRVQLIDIFTETDEGCLWSLDRSREATGTVAFPGICDDGQFDGGYGLDIDLVIPLVENCDGSEETRSSTLQLQGPVRVEALSF